MMVELLFPHGMNLSNNYTRRVYLLLYFSVVQPTSPEPWQVPGRYLPAGPVYLHSLHSTVRNLGKCYLLWLETPSNPELEVCGLPELIEAAHGAGSLVAVDNTTATPLGQKPLELGADFSVSSDTKALTGHTDLILGHVATHDPKWAEGLKAFRTQQGAIPGPMETWLAHRSLSTLQLRLSRQSENALEIAKFLAKKIGIKAVRYPGLPEDPAFKAASRQMKYFGPVVSFVLENKDQADRFLEASKLVESATSFGGIHTTAERRARWGGDNISQGFIRLSAGCEGIQDLLEDIGQALTRALNQ